MQQIWTTIQHDGPNHLGVWHAVSLVPMQQIWTVLRHDGPNHHGWAAQATKNWTTSKTVRNVFVMGSGGEGTSLDQTNSWMNGGMGHKGSLGPELGIGGMLEAAMDTTPIMMLKSCIGPHGTKEMTQPTRSLCFAAHSESLFRSQLGVFGPARRCAT